MSVLTEYVDKRYIDNLPNQRALVDITWTVAPTLQDDGGGFFDGYSHSLYFPLDRRHHDRLYEKFFGEPRVFTAYAADNRVKICRFDTRATVYETMTIEATQVYTMENANLIYTIDRVARLRDRFDLNPAAFVNADDDTFAANGRWCLRDGGVLYLGRQYTRPKFEFPISKCVRHRFNAPSTIEKRLKPPPVSDDARLFEEMGARDITLFVLFVVYDVNAFLWNRESLARFVDLMELDVPPDEFREIESMNA